ncbi:hypothetical protein ABT126_11020 [Streptomyces sp. NPDC002012]|uniref:hypothetical protein n=1 Tax=unclassified Streptomyces TaxID=2593676 RepID=UPI002E0ED1F5|nr:hypothetical protein OG609_35980 [Streptomyces sp. NBC_01224]
MPEYTPNAKGPAKVQLKPETTEPVLIPADQVKPEDIGKLSIEYRDGQPVVVVSGGRVIPAALPILNQTGQRFAKYEANPNSAPDRPSFVPDFLAIDRYEADDFTQR